MGLTKKEEDSSATENKNLFNKTKLLEEILMNRGLVKRSVSENEVFNKSAENIFYGKMKTRASPRARSFSLTDLVGEMTIRDWNSASSFEEKITAPGGDEDIKASNAGADINIGNLTPMRQKRILSPDELTPLGRCRKMSTDVQSSPILRMREELWVVEDEGIDVQINGIAPVGAAVQSYPSASNAEGRYGLVGELCGTKCGAESDSAPVEPTGACSDPMVELQKPSVANNARILKTPRRRLVSSSVFEILMSGAY